MHRGSGGVLLLPGDASHHADPDSADAAIVLLLGHGVRCGGVLLPRTAVEPGGHACIRCCRRAVIRRLHWNLRFHSLQYRPSPLAVVYSGDSEELERQMNEDLLLYIRLGLHLVTFAYLVSYRTTETSRPLVSLIAAMAAGVSLAAAAHIVLMKPQGGQMMATLLALAGAVAVARCGGNLARVFKGGRVV